MLIFLRWSYSILFWYVHHISSVSVYSVVCLKLWERQCSYVQKFPAEDGFSKESLVSQFFTSNTATGTGGRGMGKGGELFVFVCVCVCVFGCVCVCLGVCVL